MNDRIRRETQTELRTDLSSQLHVQYSREKLSRTQVTSRLFRTPCGDYVIAN
jgi:hypothetical protein